MSHNTACVWLRRQLRSRRLGRFGLSSERVTQCHPAALKRSITPNHRDYDWIEWVGRMSAPVSSAATTAAISRYPHSPLGSALLTAYSTPCHRAHYNVQPHTRCPELCRVLPQPEWVPMSRLNGRSAWRLTRGTEHPATWRIMDAPTFWARVSMDFRSGDAPCPLDPRRASSPTVLRWRSRRQLRLRGLVRL
jgi:hypothetical protein